MFFKKFFVFFFAFISPSFRLFEELVAVEREYNELLQTTLKEKRLRVERLTDLLSDNDNIPSNQQLLALPSVPSGFPLSPLVLQTKTGSKSSPICTLEGFQHLEQEPFSRVQTSLYVISSHGMKLINFERGIGLE